MSDLDLVCKLASAPDPAVLAAALRSNFDVVYVLRGELEKPVAEARSVARDVRGVAPRGAGRSGPGARGTGTGLREDRPRFGSDPPVTRDQLVASCRANLGDYRRPFA
ncbi:hypothetical protein [Pseudonocardia sp.]|uniref:hypothetical protein n=1 Tax=Pseudonocardia sp. TaxID=60912 RepID=UPI0026284310|nr:hypothetical protein [Pseudonocardia sp.]